MSGRSRVEPADTGGVPGSASASAEGASASEVKRSVGPSSGPGATGKRARGNGPEAALPCKSKLQRVGGPAARSANGVLYHGGETVSVVCRPGGWQKVCAEADERAQRERARALGCTVCSLETGALCNRARARGQRCGEEALVVRPSCEPVGAEAASGQFFGALSSARGGSIAAKKWDLTAAAPSMNELQAELNAAASKHVEKASRPDGQIAAAVSVPEARDLCAAGVKPRPCPALVLCCGGGGVAAGWAGVEDVEIKMSVDFDEKVLGVHRANFGHPTLRADLMDVEGLVERLEPLRPFGIGELSSPCVDFSPAGKGIETERSWVTIAGLLVR